MALNAEPADPQVREQMHLEAKSYAEAAEQALTQDDEPFDESSIKESPPRASLERHSSEPRPLGEIMDELERSPPPGSPVLRHPRGRLENKSSRESQISDAKSISPKKNGVTNGHAQNGHTNGHTNGLGRHRHHDSQHSIGETFDGVGEDEQPRTPTRKAHRRLSSRSLKGEKKLHPDSAIETSKDSNQGLVYESRWNKSGENLASIKPMEEVYAQKARADEQRAKADSDTKSSKQQSLVSGRQAGAGWATSAIHWAPMNVPLQRRLQTLAVLAHTLSIVGMLAIFFLICAIPLSWPLVVPYLIYLTFSRAGVDGKLTYRSEWVRRNKLWSLFAAYFPARLHRSEKLEPTRKYIFGYHPHGIISHGAFAAFTTEALGFGQLFPGITNTLLTLDSNFRIPLYRDWALRLGLASVSRESCENLLSKGGLNGEGMGRAITIVIGGAREALNATPYSLKLVLKRRKGFVKLAIRTGADLVPVLSFGENDLYEQVNGDSHPFVRKLQLFAKNFAGFTVPLFHARGVFNYDVGIMPYRRPVNIVVGKPIRVQQAANPDPAEVDRIHAEYIAELEGIWNAWKDEFAPNRKGELVITE